MADRKDVCCGATVHLNDVLDKSIGFTPRAGRLGFCRCIMCRKGVSEGAGDVMNVMCEYTR